MRRLTWHSMFDVPCLLTSPQRKLWASGLLFIFIFTWQLCFLGVWYRNLAVDMPNMLPCIYQLWCNMAAMFRTWEDSTSCVHVRTWNFIQRSFFFTDILAKLGLYAEAMRMTMTWFGLKYSHAFLFIVHCERNSAIANRSLILMRTYDEPISFHLL